MADDKETIQKIIITKEKSEKSIAKDVQCFHFTARHIKYDYICSLQIRRVRPNAFKINLVAKFWECGSFR